MISIDLTADEALLLRTTLESRRRELLHELHHTDDRAFRELLKQRETLIERMCDKLAQHEASQATGAGPA